MHERSAQRVTRTFSVSVLVGTPAALTRTRTGVVLPRALRLIRTLRFTVRLLPAATVTVRHLEPESESRWRAVLVARSAHTRTAPDAAVPVLRTRTPSVARDARRATVTVLLAAAALTFGLRESGVGGGGNGPGSGVTFGPGPGSGVDGGATVTVCVL